MAPCTIRIDLAYFAESLFVLHIFCVDVFTIFPSFYEDFALLET